MLFVYYLLVFEIFHLVLYGIYRVTMKIPFLGAIYRFFEQIGVYFHEISHIVMIKATLMPAKIKKVRIKKGSGSVIYDLTRQASFLQAFFVGFSPLIVGTELILITTYVFTFSGLELALGMRILLFICGFSIIVVISPSWQDMKNVLANLIQYPIIAIRQIGFLIVAWVLQIEWMEEYDLIANPMLEFPILFIILAGMELIFAIFVRIIRFDRKAFTQTRVGLEVNPYDMVVKNFVEQDLRGSQSKMTDSDDPRFKQRFAALMDSFVKQNTEK